MKIGINTFLLSSGFSNDDLPLIDQFKAWGSDVIELAIVEPGALDVAALQNALEAAGMAGSPLCGVFPPGRDLRGTEAEQQATVGYMNEMIDLAQQLGARMICGPMYSYVGRCNMHTKTEKAEQSDLVARNLEPLCRKAESAGVVLAMEPLNRFETDFINTFGQARAMIEKVGSPALKIHLDTFHANIEESDTAASIREAGSLIGHVHISASHRGIPGQDQVDWHGVFRALHEVGYDGDLVIETFALDNDIIARAASIWFQRFDTPEQLAREGIAFVRKTWAQTA